MSAGSRDEGMDRRDFLKTLLAGASLAAFDWAAFPRSSRAAQEADAWDAVIIGSGLGGLSCAAAFARHAMKPLVLEQHTKPGGYATTFKRPGGFEFDVSLHSTVVGERSGVHNLIPGFPEIEDVEFVPHTSLYRLILPEHDIRVPQKDLDGYAKLLATEFPDEAEGIKGLIEDMEGLVNDIAKYSSAGGEVNMMAFPTEFPYLFKCFNKTWGQVVDARISDPKLKGIVSALWGYYGLPPSKLASIYYAMPTIEFLKEGGYYARGRSQKISDTFVKFIEERGGKVQFRTRVEKVLTKDGAAYGVRTADGKEYTGRVVVSNANAHDLFHKMLDEEVVPKDYMEKMGRMAVSLSSFQVWLGLKKDLVREVGLPDTEIFCGSGYDPEAEFQRAVKGEIGGDVGAMVYDNLYDGYSPEGKNTITLIALQGYDYWEKYEADYRAGKKDAYRKEKERLADILIDAAQEKVLPGLRDAIEVKEIGTPLTNMRYTRNWRGAIYGWDQTLDNAEPNRMKNKTPVKNLYLASAWGSPGGGYGGVIHGGLSTFAEIMASW